MGSRCLHEISCKVSLHLRVCKLTKFITNFLVLNKKKKQKCINYHVLALISNVILLCCDRVSVVCLVHLAFRARLGLDFQGQRSVSFTPTSSPGL